MLADGDTVYNAEPFGVATKQVSDRSQLPGHPDNPFLCFQDHFSHLGQPPSSIFAYSPSPQLSPKKATRQANNHVKLVIKQLESEQEDDEDEDKSKAES